MPKDGKVRTVGIRVDVCYSPGECTVEKSELFALLGCESRSKHEPLQALPPGFCDDSDFLISEYLCGDIPQNSIVNFLPVFSQVLHNTTVKCSDILQIAFCWFGFR